MKIKTPILVDKNGKVLAYFTADASHEILTQLKFELANLKNIKIDYKNASLYNDSKDEEKENQGWD